MHVTCPGCSTRYALPRHLVGAAGARVCCPSCGTTFVTGPAGELTAIIGRVAPPTLAAWVEAGVSGEPAPGDAAEAQAIATANGDSAGPASPAPRALARAALAALDDPPGMLATAVDERRLFADHGPALLAAFEALADESPDADIAGEFRLALRELTGLDLTVTGD